MAQPAASAQMAQQFDKAEMLQRSYTPAPQPRRQPGPMKLGPHYRAVTYPAKPIRFRFGTRTIHASAASVDSVHQKVLRLQLQPSLAERLVLFLAGLLPAVVRTRFEASFPEWALPQCVIVKQKKEGWDKEFEDEKAMYALLRPLQGVVIPCYLGEVAYGNKRAILLSDIGGAALAEPEGLLLEMPDLRRMMRQAVAAIGQFGRVHDDSKLDNYHLVGDKIMIIDLERMSEHVDDLKLLDFFINAEVEHIVKWYERTQYGKWTRGLLAVDMDE